VILLHDGVAQTIEALPIIIDTLRARGFTFVTVDQMAGRICPEGNKPYQR
jgi:peptidoglycan/xylan/chitin deacetylase (PgdA/CDA1 family)